MNRKHLYEKDTYFEKFHLLPLNVCKLWIVASCYCCFSAVEVTAAELLVCFLVRNANEKRVQEHRFIPADDRRAELRAAAVSEEAVIH